MKSLLTSFFSFLKKKKIPTKENIIEIKNQPFSFYKGVLIFSCLLVICLFWAILMSISNRFSIEVPDYGGNMSFGVIGAPRFINPLLSSSETDQALTYLVYSGLVKETDQGTLESVLASRFVVSPDGKEYRFTLKDNLVFSNKTPLTSNDVVFTFERKKQLALLADPTSDWVSISVSAPDDKTVLIGTSGHSKNLNEKLSLGIVPKALWENIELSTLEDSTLNTNPVGSGPFVVNNINYSSTVPKEVFLKRNRHFAGKKPYINKINLHIYANQLDLVDGLKSSQIQGTAMLNGVSIDKEVKNSFIIKQTPTAKNIALFSNQPEKGSATAMLLSVINREIDKNNIIDIIENGYGIPLYKPLGTSTTDSEDIVNIFAKLGYKQNEFGKLTKSGSEITIPIVLRKDEQLLQNAEELSKELSRYGITTELKVFDQGLFTDQVNGLMFPFILGTETDIPQNYQNLIPLYTKIIPTVITKQIYPALPTMIENRSQVFKNIEFWYIQTDKIWKWFK